MTSSRIQKKGAPWEWLVIGAGVAVLQVLLQGGLEPFLLLAFIVAAGLEYLFKEWRYPNWRSIACGTVVALGVRFLVVDYTVVKTNGMAPTIQQGARVFYQPAFFTVRPGDLVLFKPEKFAPAARTGVGQVKEAIDDHRYKVVHLPLNAVVMIERDLIRGKIIWIANPPETQRNQW